MQRRANGKFMSTGLLRVDVHGTTIEGLRQVHAVYKPDMPYYQPRHSDP